MEDTKDKRDVKITLFYKSKAHQKNINLLELFLQLVRNANVSKEEYNITNAIIGKIIFYNVNTICANYEYNLDNECIKVIFKNSDGTCNVLEVPKTFKNVWQILFGYVPNNKEDYH